MAATLALTISALEASVTRPVREAFVDCALSPTHSQRRHAIASDARRTFIPHGQKNPIMLTAAPTVCQPPGRTATDARLNSSVTCFHLQTSKTRRHSAIRCCAYWASLGEKCGIRLCRGQRCLPSCWRVVPAPRAEPLARCQPIRAYGMEGE